MIHLKESDSIPLMLPTPTQAPRRTSTILIFLLGLAIYFVWLDIVLYTSLHNCSGNSTDLITVKSIMQPPTVHYLEVPISEWLQVTLSLSEAFTPNFISCLGVLYGISASWLISWGTRSKILFGIVLYKLRDLMDALDGVIARGVGAAVVPTPGTSGYYVDGWCDVASDAALLLAIGCLLDKANVYPGYKPVHHPTSSRLLAPIMHHPIMIKVLAPISLPIIVLAMQSLLSAVCWNWTTTQLHILLEAENTSNKEKQIQLFHSTSCWLVMYFWRLLNPHSLSQALLVSLLVDRTKQWVEHARVVVTLPLGTLCLASWVWVYILGIELNVN